jgi:hypothetical protein
MIDNSTAEVFPCRCSPEDCDYKLQWVEAGSPFRIPFDVAIGKRHMPLVSEWLKAKYCNRKGEQTILKL